MLPNSCRQTGQRIRRKLKLLRRKEKAGKNAADSHRPESNRIGGSSVGTQRTLTEECESSLNLRVSSICHGPDDCDADDPFCDGDPGF